MIQRRSTPEETSFSITIHNKTIYLLFFCSNDVKVYDLENFQLKYELNHERQAQMYEYRMTTTRKIPMDIIMGGGVIAKNDKYPKFDLPWEANTHFIYATFIAKTNKIMIGLSNDTIQIWNWGFRSLKQTINIQRLRKKYLKIHQITPVEPFYDSDEETIDTIVQNLTEESGDSLISDMKLSRSGFYCVVTLQFVNEIMIFLTSTSTTASSNDKHLTRNTSLAAATVYIPMWEIFKIIKINNDFHVARTSFIVPWLPPYHPLRNTSIDSKFLVCHSKNENLSIINVENLARYNIVSNSNANKYACSPNGKMLCSIGGKDDGQITLYSVTYFVEKIHEKETQRKLLLEQVYDDDEDDGACPDNFNRKVNVVKRRLEFIHKEVRGLYLVW